MTSSERDIPVIGRYLQLRRLLEGKAIVWNLAFLEMTPCLYTGGQPERVKEKLLNNSIFWCIIDCWRIWFKVVFHFLIIFNNCPKKWLMGFFCSWVYNKTVVDYWGIGHYVMSTWEYQYWPGLRLSQYWYSKVDITSCPMLQYSQKLYNILDII